MTFRTFIAVFNIVLSIVLIALVINNARIKEELLELMGRFEMLCDMKGQINTFFEIDNEDGDEDGDDI